MDSASPSRQEALRALVDCIRDFDQVATKLHVTALWVLETYADEGDPATVEMTETVRMLPVLPDPDRPGRPPVPPLPSTGSVTGDAIGSCTDGREHVVLAGFCTWCGQEVL